MKEPVKDIDSYLALQPEDVRAALEKLRKVIKAAAPDAEETISYAMPMFKYNGMLVGFAAAKDHCGFYPCNSTSVTQFKDDLKGFSTSKGTIRFTTEKPLPDALVKKIVKERMKENASKATRK